jgi:hypothetical protein
MRKNIRRKGENIDRIEDYVYCMYSILVYMYKGASPCIEAYPLQNQF